MPAFDLGECLHDPEFAPSREGPANRFLNVCPTAQRTCIRVGVYAQKIGSTEILIAEKFAVFSTSEARRQYYALTSGIDIFYNHSERLIALCI